MWLWWEVRWQHSTDYSSLQWQQEQQYHEQQQEQQYYEQQQEQQYYEQQQQQE